MCDQADTAGLSAESTGNDALSEDATLSSVEFTEVANAETGRRRA